MTSDEMIGKKFNKLRIIERRYNPKYRKTQFLCKCDCGNETIVDRPKILSGHTQSCGCLQRERTSKAKYRHGKAGSNLYKVWSEMKRRCSNPNNYAYKNYGGRGITVCEEWQDFISFNKWAMAKGYKEGLTIERIDNDRGYSPDNCKWATRIEQGRNKRDSLYVNYKGKDVLLKELAEMVDKDYKLLHNRIFRQNWGIERAVNEPVRKRGV